jgi:hypothetical protein
MRMLPKFSWQPSGRFPQACLHNDASRDNSLIVNGRLLPLLLLSRLSVEIATSAANGMRTNCARQEETRTRCVCTRRQTRWWQTAKMQFGSDALACLGPGRTMSLEIHAKTAALLQLNFHKLD